MFAAKHLARPLHSLEIELPRIMMCVAIPERRYHWPIHDPVNVRLLDRRIARVKIVSDNFTRQHAHVPADIPIDRRTQLRARDLALDRNIRDLPFSVDTRIRAARSMNVDAATVNQRERFGQLALNSPAPLLDLPPMEVSPVVLKQQFVIHGAAFRLPGFTTGSPSLQASHAEDSTDNTRNDASGDSGTPTSAVAPERSMIDAAPTTSAPALRTASIVSRVDPPVVITSSTIKVFSPRAIVNPRRNVIWPASRSVQTNLAPNARATSCPITIPPIAGDATNSIPCPRNFSAIARPNASAFCG